MDTQQTNKKSSAQAFNNYRVKNLEKFREYSKNFYHEKQKNDPEFMEKKKQAALARYYEKKKDPEFVEKERIRAKERYQKLKEQKLKEKQEQL